jgi:hypothetical protein
MSRTPRERPLLRSAVASSPWIVVSIGVLVMVVLLVVALSTARGKRTYAEPPPPDAPMSLPGVPATTASPEPTATASARPAGSPRPSASTPVRPTSSAAGGGTARPAPSPSPTSSSPPASSAAPALAASAVTGRYAVASRWDTGFIGEVLIANTGSSASDWTVRLSFPEGRVADSWLVGEAQGRSSVWGGDLVYRSGAALAAGASVRLRFRIDTAVATRPDGCTVNGSRCTGL